ncbi:aminotransferase-like domain-containing protein [Streptomyces sp. RKAG337]|uniref:aminotransferase-like domain-containing protein n=1 Tax=Streptomyces sp. RKAG337 TaxID=2893404 RepID=UPI00203338F8|nr:PLP-dependent aminotransferase family protein [Streptomyces sp. RKAG337]MCM2429992.1 PLP-dependent aminotransferase family protein [Streptomyces sp. RKAG337]
MTSPTPAGDAVLRIEDLHGSLRDPVLDAMNFLNEVVSRYPEAISFAPGRPYDPLLDPAVITDCLTAWTDHLRRDRGLGEPQISTLLMQYGPTAGIIREPIARSLAEDEGIDVPPEAIVVTVGAQEGMLLVLRALCAGPDDVLLAPSPCYVGISGAARLLDIPLFPVPEGEHGIDAADVAAAARRARAQGLRPRALYLVPDFANPSGVCMTVPARRELLAAAGEEGLLILEDNPYGMFRADAESTRPTLKALDTDRRVIYLGSLAKTGFPGARIGYVVADQRVEGPGGSTLLADQLAKVKSMTTVNTPALSQAVIGGLLVRHGFRMRTASLAAAAFYRENMARLLDALDRYFPEPERTARGIDWNRPEGGFFVVLSVPFDADERALERSAGRHQVLWTPMSPFYIGGGGVRRLRLSCSAVPPELVDEGVRRFAEFVAESESPAVHHAVATSISAVG